MAFREIELPWDAQPQEFAAIDGRWLDAGLSSVFAPGVFGLAEPLRGVSWAQINAPLAEGAGVSFTGGSNNSFLSAGIDTDLLMPDNEGSIFMLLRFNDTTARAAQICGYTGASTNRVILQPWNDGNIYFDFANATAGSGRVSGAYTKTGAITSMAGIAGGGKGRQLWYDGRVIGSNTGGTASRGDGSNWHWGDPSGGQASMTDAFTLFCGLTFSRALSDSMVQELHATQGGALFSPRRIWVPQAAITGLPTLSASTYKPGTLTSTGWTARITAS